MKPSAPWLSMGRVVGYALLLGGVCRLVAPVVHPGVVWLTLGAHPPSGLKGEAEPDPAIDKSQSAQIIDKIMEAQELRTGPRGRADVRGMLARGANINDRSSEGTTLLTVAVQWSDIPEVKRLLTLGADPNRRDRERATPLQYATTENHSGVPDIGIVVALLRGGADPNQPYSDGSLPLTSDVAYRPDLLRILLKAGAHLNAHDAQGLTPLMAAPQPLDPRSDAQTPANFYPPSDAVKLLLQHGAEPNARDHAGRPPLYYTLVSPHTYMEGIPQNELHTVFDMRGLKLLLAHGADVRARDHAGMTALHWAVLPVYEDQDYSDETGGYTNARIRALRFLLERGLPVDSRDNQGRTPLMLAVESYYQSSVRAPYALLTVKFLLQRGADPSARDQNGRTVLDRAHCEWTMTQLLRAHGAR